MRLKLNTAETRSVQLAVSLRPSTLEQIDELRAKLGMSRSAFVASLIEFGVEDNKIIIKAVSKVLPLLSPKNVEAALVT